jgi:hypothetical protein
MASNDVNGIPVGYAYDVLNRPITVVDNRLPANQDTTNYIYDPVSSLATVTYPHGLQFSFAYDDLNRLKVLITTKSTYNYLPGLTGNRLSATESSGRPVNWSYDGIYRLANETVNLNPPPENGAVAYDDDTAGIRLPQTSSFSGISTGCFTGKERDSETGLDFFGARYFSGAQGRFTSRTRTTSCWR